MAAINDCSSLSSTFWPTSHCKNIWHWWQSRLPALFCAFSSLCCNDSLQVHQKQNQISSWIKQVATPHALSWMPFYVICRCITEKDIYANFAIEHRLQNFFSQKSLSVYHSKPVSITAGSPIDKYLHFSLMCFFYKMFGVMVIYGVKWIIKLILFGSISI